MDHTKPITSAADFRERMKDLPEEARDIMTGLQYSMVMGYLTGTPKGEYEKEVILGVLLQEHGGDARFLEAYAEDPDAVTARGVEIGKEFVAHWKKRFNARVGQVPKELPDGAFEEVNAMEKYMARPEFPADLRGNLEYYAKWCSLIGDDGEPLPGKKEECDAMVQAQADKYDAIEKRAQNRLN